MLSRTTDEVKTPLAAPAIATSPKPGSFCPSPGERKFIVYLYEVKTEAFIRATPSCDGSVVVSSRAEGRESRGHRLRLTIGDVCASFVTP